MNGEYQELQKRIRPVVLSNQENRESGREEAAIELLKTLRRELGVLAYRREISHNAIRLIYGLVQQRAFKLGYVGLPD